MANQEHNLEEIFREAFASHEMEVSANVWSGIESSLGQASAGTASGTSAGSGFLGKAAAIMGFAGLMTAATIAEIDYQNGDQTQVASTEEVQTISEDHIVSDETVAIVKDESPSLNSATASERTIVEEVSRHSSDEVAGYQTSEAQTNPVQEASMDESVALVEATPAIEKPIESQSDKLGSTYEGGLESNSDDENNNQSGTTAVNDQSVEPAPASTPETDNKQENNATRCQVVLNHPGTMWLTPNGDGFNDHVQFDGYDFESFQVMIASRTGEVVFQADSYEMANKWDGTDKFGNPLPNGTYYFQIVAQDANGVLYKDSNAMGSIDLRR